jgi:predicted nucleic acid-binding protein
MRNFEQLTPDQIVEAAPDDREDEAREVAAQVEDLVMDLDDAMYQVQQVTEKE